MRPVEKGSSPGTYTNYQDARNDLCDRIGWYCSYCEMPIRNMPEVEHVAPVVNNGALLDWDNFLISCKYCNVNKKDHNQGRANYIWPDHDNTLRALEYSYGTPIRPSGQLSAQEISLVLSTIELCGLHKEPGNHPSPSKRDTRWKSRYETWSIAQESYQDWLQLPSDVMKRQIIRTARGHGHFSIWMTVFKSVSKIKEELINSFPNTARDCFDTNFDPVRRPTGVVKRGNPISTHSEITFLAIRHTLRYNKDNESELNGLTSRKVVER